MKEIETRSRTRVQASRRVEISTMKVEVVEITDTSLNQRVFGELPSMDPIVKIEENDVNLKS